MSGLVPERAGELARLLGDPEDPTNPTGVAAVLDADERAEMLAAGESLLHGFGLNEEFVPAEHGGRLTRLDHLVEVLRTVYRRDPALGLGYGAASFIAAVTVWTAADPEQAARVAALLRDGRRVAVAFHELEHGNDMAGAAFRARPDGDGWSLSGRKEIVTNIGRAEAMVVFARTDPRPGPRSHSLVLVERSAVPPGRLTDLGRYPTTGVRGVQLGGCEFHDVPVPARAVLGPVGTGLETALTALQITRTTLPAMATGALDTALGVAVEHLGDRRLYGGAAIELPLVRAQLAGVFVDLLRAEAVAAVGTRALHLLPGSSSVYASAVKFAVSRLVLDAMDRLAALLGTHSYVREGPRAIFQKLLRDVAPIGFGHIARAACQMSLLPQLPLLARRSWTAGAPAPDALFRLGDELPPLSYDRLALHARGRDPLAASLTGLLDGPWDGDHGDLRAAAGTRRADLTDLAGTCAALPVGELGVLAAPATYDLVTRYVRLLGDIACLQVWRHADPSGPPFLADPTWVRAALHRSAGDPVLPGPVDAALVAELLDRHRTRRTYGLSAHPDIPTSPTSTEATT